MAALIERYRLPFALVLLVVLIGGGAAFLARRPEAIPIQIATPTRVAQPAKTAATYAARTAPTLKVYVTGDVANPGVYTLSDGDRVQDALQAAGGAMVDADLVKVNLAARVQDQMEINVPRKSADPSVSPEPTSGKAKAQTTAVAPDASFPAVRLKTNLNTATEPELDALPGVGPVTAQRIITYRSQNDPFKQIDDLKTAKLVNSSTFDKIKDLITAP